MEYLILVWLNFDVPDAQIYLLHPNWVGRKPVNLFAKTVIINQYWERIDFKQLAEELITA